MTQPNRYEEAEQRPAVRYEALELQPMTDEEWDNFASSFRDPDPGPSVGFHILATIVIVIAAIAVTALLVSRAGPEAPPTQPEATTRVPASVVASPRPSPTPAPSVASLTGGAGSEGGVIPPTTPTSGSDEALGVLPVTSTIQTGTATYCAPTPRYCHGWGGTARLGAVKSFRWGDRPYYVRVRSGGHSVVVKVVSYCACGVTLIDLSPYAFQRLAPLWKGRIRVTVERVGHGSVSKGPVATLPPTSTR